MSRAAQELPKKELPDRIHRELRKGETIYHSTMACHVSAKYPEGKWIGQVRREEKGKLVKYPVKGYGTPKEALDYVKSLRPDARGRVRVEKRGEPTVADLYEYVTKQRQKRNTEYTKKGKETRWRLHIEPEWGHMPLSKVTRRAAHEWITEVETRIENGQTGDFGLGQLEKVRIDLHTLFEALDSFSSDYEDRKNPFGGLDYSTRPPRQKVTIESQHFPAIHYVCQRLVEEGLVTDWISTMFMTSLLSGLRQGETVALCRDQLDFKNGAIVVDRAMRRTARAIDPKTRLETGPVLRHAMNLPKGGTPANNKTRVVPMTDQLARILLPLWKQPSTAGNWDLLWPSTAGTLKEMALFRTVWQTLMKRLHEVATLAPITHEAGPWPEIPKLRGWTRNPLIEEARRNPAVRLPDVFGDIDYRDTRNSFASYMNEVGLSQATREHILGHANGLTNFTYTEVTSKAFQDARKRLSKGWKAVT
jgi:integrase